MVDYFRRIWIAGAVIGLVGILFIGTVPAYAKTIEEELINSLIWPTEGDISDHYGTRGGRHFGIDIAAPEGTPIVSIKEGTVSRSYYSDTYGNVIFVKHDAGLETIYAHMHERYVSEGDFVKQGQVIGTVGNTGRSSGNHLHFEVHVGEWNLRKTNSIDPLLVLKDEPNSLVAGIDEKNAEDEFQEVLSARYQLIQDENEEVVNEQHFTYSNKTTKFPINKGDTSKEQITDITDQPITLTVEKGDTLWSLAQQHQVSVDQLKKWNELENEFIHVEQNLIVYTEENELVHVVKAGETLHGIANEYSVSIATIRAHNDLKGDLIFPGDVLQVTE
ncbi:M23 family metallopeptidase [Alkalihalobacterium chitinilyticum]|uniref:Peptidoglycan DD-metalloendopeptidase family protein n=1 Tax=Alkalihalobacterium chitinilyticum TaxID=2980103 RepID=A0ABT5V937_9BACI|nr:peptidoglycan DD-metalloendopeptidase family protein [Alkalihalobacterium chitinilyticum]MDE5411983.1 peptidoglycan DD-metalloendopeptidase family protein [Alkalihalobacterium chitinilyticum]